VREGEERKRKERKGGGKEGKESKVPQISGYANVRQRPLFW